MMKIDITTLQYWIAPVTAPIPTAIAVGANLTHSIATIPGISANLALIGGIGGAVATEVSGGLMFSMTAKAFLRRQWGAFWVALAGSIGYVGVVAWSVSVTKDSSPIIGAVVVSALVYVAVSLYQYFRDMDANRVIQNERQDKLRAEQAENERQRTETERLRIASEAENERQRTLQANAVVRQVKAASTGQPALSVGQARTSGQNKQALDPDILERVRAWINAHPDKTTCREIAEGVGIGHSTAAKYKAALK